MSSTVGLTLVVALFLAGPASAIYNPLSLYVDSEEGFALSHIESGGDKIFDSFLYFSSIAYYFYFGFHNPEHYPDLQIKTKYNKIIINEQINNNTFDLDIWYYDLEDIANNRDAGYVKDAGRRFESIPYSDGSIALKCQNGLYLSWGSDYYTFYCFDEEFKDCGPSADPCTEISPNCPNCKFFPKVGSVEPVYIEIVSIDWGEVDGEIIGNPSVINTKQVDNWSDEILNSNMEVTFTDSTTDTTDWEHAWGFELCAESETTIKIPFTASETIDIAATLSYDGKYGTSNSKEASVDLKFSDTFPCPPRSRCYLHMIARHLDNVDIPYTARVKKTVGGSETVWNEEGTWKGVKMYDQRVLFCTEDLDTHDSNCPEEIKLQPIKNASEEIC